MSTGDGTTTMGAAQKLRSFLLSEPSQPTEKESAPVQETEPKEPKAEKATPETPESEPKEEPLLFTVKPNGEEKQVTLEELTLGYMREDNYRKKTMEVADQRKNMEAKQLEIDNDLKEAKALLDFEFDNLNSDEMRNLRQDNPDAYIANQDKAKEKRKKFDSLKAKRTLEQKSREDKLVAKERDALFTAFPEWSDTAKAQTEMIELQGVLKKSGFSDSEVMSTTDHRLFVMANQIKKLNAIQNADLESKKTTPKSKTIKPGAATDVVDRQNETRDKQRQKLRKSGSMKDAAALLRI